MSTKEDEYFSGTSLDVAEQNSSSPPATVPSQPGSGSQEGHDTKQRGSSGKGSGKSDDSSNSSRSKSKDGSGWSMTLMRTHSAPPDEHAGTFETGSNGVRVNQFQSFGGQPMMINPSSNSELQTSSNLPQAYPSVAQPTVPTHVLNDKTSGGGPNADSLKQPLATSLSPSIQHSSKKTPQQHQQQGGSANIPHQQQQHQQVRYTQSNKQSQQHARGGDQTMYMDPNAQYDPTRVSAAPVMQGQRVVPVSGKMMAVPQGQQLQQQPHPQFQQHQQLQPQGQNVYQQYHPQQQQIVGVNSQMQPLSYQPMYMYYDSRGGHVQQYPVAQQQPAMRPASTINQQPMVIGQQGEVAGGGVRNSSGMTGNGKGLSSNGNTPPQAHPQGGSVPVMTLNQSPLLMAQQQSSGSPASLSPLPPSQGIGLDPKSRQLHPQHQQSAGGGGMTFGNGVSAQGYPIQHQQQPMRGNGGVMYMNTQPGGAPIMYNVINSGQIPHQPMHQPMHPSQQPLNSAPNPVKETKKLVLKDKDGNVIDMSTFAKKDASPSTSATMATNTAAASTTTVPKKENAAPTMATSSSVPPLPTPSSTDEQKKSEASVIPSSAVSSVASTSSSDAVTKAAYQSASVATGVVKVHNIKNTTNNSNSDSDSNSGGNCQAAAVTIPASPKLFGSSGVLTPQPVTLPDASANIKSKPGVVDQGGYEIYDPLAEKEKLKKEEEEEEVSKSKASDEMEKEVTPPPKVHDVDEKVSIEDASTKVDSRKDIPSKEKSVDGDSSGPVNISINKIPNVIPYPTPSISPGGVLDKRSKRNKLKDRMAQADASSNSGSSGSVLDAYVKHDDVKSVDPVPVSKVSTPPPAPVSDVSLTTPDIQEVEDSWEVQATKIEQAEMEKEKEKEKEKVKPPPVVPAKRSLRPGGGLDKKSGVGSSAAKQNVIRYVYKKHEITKLKPLSGQVERPPECSIFVNIVVTGGESRQQGGNWKGQGGHDHRGSQSMQQQQMYSQQLSQHHLPQGGHGAAGSDAGWQRGHHQPPADGGGGGGGRRKNRGPVPPMVKKVITDPIEIMSREVTDILNKIAPQTFQKLTSSLCAIQVHNLQMLHTLVRLIFDKAVTEPAYAMLYADMCQTLDAANTYAKFFNVVFNKDTNQYFWIKDLNYTNELAGPYGNREECINAVIAVVPPPLVEVTHAVELDFITVVNGILISIIKSVDREEYFVSFVPNADVDESLKSPQFYSSHEAAHKSGLKKHSFQKTLVSICQEEYQMSTTNQGIYAEPAIRRAQLMERRSAGMDPEEYEALAEEVDNFEMVVKKRMMGNIRFIGELCKRKMIRTGTMHQCIQVLLDVKEGEKVDGGNVELVCKLLTSIGQKLEQDALSADDRSIVNSYYDRLSELRNDKSIYSRIRFSIDEVVELRRNNWVTRIAQDGPATLEEIRKRALEDEERKALAQQQLHAGHHYGKGGKGGSRGGPQDVRSSGRGGSNIGRNTSGGSGGGHHKGKGHDGSDRRGSGGGGDGGSRGKGGGRQVDRKNSPAPAPAPPPAQVKQKEMSPDLLKKRTATIVNEFVSSGNEQEALECLAELPPQGCGFLVSNMMDKYLNSNKSAEQKSILQLCSVVMPQLKAASSHVETAVMKDESLEFLCDFMMDVFSAPELMGDVLQLLIDGRALKRELLNQRLAELRKINKEDEYGVADEQLKGAHDRLISKLH